MARIVTFGEIMLRLPPPGNERLFQSPSLATNFGGAEANVAVSLDAALRFAVAASAVKQTIPGDFNLVSAAAAVARLAAAADGRVQR